MGKKHIGIKGKLLSSTTLAVLAMSSIASAQTTSDDEIVVVGVRSSLSQAIDVKRNETEFVDALVAEDFAEFPDSNLGEALQRIPGITVERNDGGSQSTAVGEGATINVRGLGPAFTRTEINGMTATNPGQSRGFGFNVLASELFSSAVVRKSLSAKDNEGGLAGTVELNTYRPLEQKDKVLSVSAKGTYGELAEEFDHAGTVIYSDKNEAGTFGASLGLTYDKRSPVENIVDNSNWDFLRDSLRGNFDLLSPTERAAIQNVLIPRDPRIIKNTRDQTRINAMANFQWAPSDDLTISFDNLYANVEHTGRQTRNDFPIEGFPATSVPADLVTNGDIFVSGTFPAASHFMRIIDYDYGVDTEIYQGILKAEWQASDNLVIIPSIGYSTAEEDFHTWNSFDLRSVNTDIFYEVNGDFTQITPAIGSQSDPNNFTRVSRIRNRPDFDKDKEFSARVDSEYSLNKDFFQSIEFGLRYSDREKAFRRFDGRATLTGLVTNLPSFLAVEEFDFDGSPTGFPTGIVSVTDFTALQNAADPDGFEVPEVELSRYNVTEKTLAGYVMTNFDNDAFSGNAGLRVVNTDQNSTGFQRVGGVLQPASFDNDYTFILPSLNMKYDISDTFVARGAIYRSLTRPQLTDIQPSQSFDNFDGGNGTSGNPELEPFTSWNFDIGAEWYFGEDSLVSVSYFRKELNGLIERFVSEEQVTDQTTGEIFTVNLSRPVNGESAKIQGIEAGLQTPFTQLPGILRNTGMLVNATWTDSEAVFANTADIRSSSLPGLSEFSYNAILYYDAAPFNARLAYNWRSDYLITVSGSGGLPVSRDDYGQLDFSSSFDVNDALSVSFDVLNVTDNQIRSFSNLNEALTKGLIDTGRKYSVGLNYKF